MRALGPSAVAAVVGLGVAFAYAGPDALLLAALLALLEGSLSFDNAVVNARVLGRMSRLWQNLFLTIGIAIAVFGMRLVFPILIVAAATHSSPSEVVDLALSKGDPATPGTYGYALHQAHPAIAAFGGTFLLAVFLDFMATPRELQWLGWLERPLSHLGRVERSTIIIVLGALLLASYAIASDSDHASTLTAGVVGLLSYALVSGLSEAVLPGEGVGQAIGLAAFMLFLYVEMLDASFSLDGVVGAFALTDDPFLIAIGLGIGAVFTRSLTVLLVRTGTLARYEYLEHGAMWAIGALSLILLASMKYDVPQLVAGLVGVGFIGAALASSLVRRHRVGAAAEHM